MKKLIYLFALMALMVMVIPSCETEETDKTPAEQLVGKWDISSTEILTQVIPGDGSYLIFEECGAESCGGTDYMAGDGTTGTFSYVLNEDATTLTIEDSSSDGGSYNGTWDVLELTNDELRIFADTGLFGTLKIELTKASE
jgi:hypothetical protein